MRLSRDNDIDPDLARLLEEQERAIALTRRVAAQVAAPAALRARIEAMRKPRSVGTAALVGALAASAAVAAALSGVRDSATTGGRLHAVLRPTGEATLTKTSSGWRIELHAAGLPRRAGGRFYTASLRNADGVGVSIGTFNDGTNVTLWAGVSPKTFKSLIVRTSSGVKVLAGTVGP